MEMVLIRKKFPTKTTLLMFCKKKVCVGGGNSMRMLLKNQLGTGCSFRSKNNNKIRSRSRIGWIRLPPLEELKHRREVRGVHGNGDGTETTGLGSFIALYNAA